MSEYDQMVGHQVNSSGNCVIAGCPCRGWSAQEGAELGNNWQRERFPVGARVEAVIPISRSRLGADIPVGTRGKVTSHCDDGRAWVFFDDYNEGHTFHEIERFVRVVCTHQNDDERCPANATSTHQPAARGGGKRVILDSDLVVRPLPGTTRFLLVVEDNDWPIAEFYREEEVNGIAYEHNQHQSLVVERETMRAAIRRFVDAYADGKAARLGNGQARRSWDEFRQLLTAYDNDQKRGAR